MTAYAAFLCAVNIGRRQTKSADLKEVFAGLGFANVRTVIASGNVVFEAKPAKDLAATIEKALAARFGFAIGVILRSIEDLRAMIASAPFAAASGDVACHVLLFARPMRAVPDLEGIPGDVDIARADRDAIYFIVHRKPDGTYLGRSRIGDVLAPLEKGHLVTMRNWNTIQKVAA